MSRRTRKQLLLVDEELDRTDREEEYRELEIQLHNEWREKLSVGAKPEVRAYLSVLYKRERYL
ncbi:MAG: hypothetical protein JWQ81_6162 [Amycolatopsis sp.]|nr:hypothetical protein [Amycolatopsis sp.]